VSIIVSLAVRARSSGGKAKKESCANAIGEAGSNLSLTKRKKCVTDQIFFAKEMVDIKVVKVGFHSFPHWLGAFGRTVDDTIKKMD
jgi:hypothetical protein